LSFRISNFEFPKEVWDMSTPATPSPSLHPTRRQLDELDALMDRMLELPVNPAVEDHSAGDTAAEPTPPLDFSVAGFESYRTEEVDLTAINETTGLESPTSPSVSENPILGPEVDPSRTPFVFHSPTTTNFPGMQGYSGSLTSAHGLKDDEPPAPFWLWPIVGINRPYAAIMGRLGAPGRIMLGIGRTWLGWIGLIMLAAALAWGIFDWIHWAG
jgi:hypothetical protein